MADPAAVRHFEHGAVTYARFRGGWPIGRLRQTEQRALWNLAPVRPGERVLDAGCGDGDLLSQLMRLGADAVGVDVARPMARECRRRGLRVCVQDIEQLGLRPRFDWVFCVGVIEFTRDMAGAIHNLAGCLRPHGRMALLFPRSNSMGRLYAAYHWTHGVRAHLLTRRQMTALLLGAGFDRPVVWRDCLLSTVCVAEWTGGTESCGSPLTPRHAE